jgi:hypothetical protein
MRIAILVAVVVGVIIVGDLAFNDGHFAREVQRAFARMMMGN